MKIEFLENYEKNEYEYNERLYNNIKDNPDLKTIYLQDSRFNKLLDPIVYPDQLSYGLYEEPVWSQIPFAGTTIIPLNPCSKENFFKEHGFEIKDISSLIGFVNETAKVQFVLSKGATLYKDMDYLEPIFNELKPPMLLIPWQPIGANDLYDEWVNEFNDLVVPHLQTNIQHAIEEIGETQAYYKTVMMGYLSTYIQLKLLKLENALEEIRDYVIHDPSHIRYSLDKYNSVLSPIFDPLKGNQNYSFKTLKLFNIKPNRSDGTVTYPIDIGKFLMKKIVGRPDTLFGCIEAIQHYESNDLYRVLEALNKKIKEENTYDLIDTTKDLERILYFAWKDADKYNNYKKAISTGIDLAIGIGGTIATIGLPLNQNLLVALGLSVSSRLLNFKLSIEDKILERLLNKNYLYCIYDFKQRHKLHS